MYRFDAKKVTGEIVQWIRDFFEANGKGCMAVVAVSGGKDSSVTAALCAEALGKPRVLGVLLPNGRQPDIGAAEELVNFLGIGSVTLNIEGAYKEIMKGLKESLSCEVTEQTKVNLPPRVRMAAVYAVSQSMNGRVANTSNLSEDWIGYSTRYGDTAGDFSPLSQLTAHEVMAVGTELKLPASLVYKTPADGLTGRTDEDNLGFTYAALDKYLRTGVCEDGEVKKKIDSRRRANRFKLEPMPSFPCAGPILAEDGA